MPYFYLIVIGQAGAKLLAAKTGRMEMSVVNLHESDSQYNVQVILLANTGVSSLFVASLRSRMIHRVTYSSKIDRGVI
jgi:hypothetical protein